MKRVLRYLVLGILLSCLTCEAIAQADEVDTLIKELKDKDSGVRENAAFALGYTGDNRAVEPLINALKDGNLDVRQKAVDALRKIRGY